MENITVPTSQVGKPRPTVAKRPGQGCTAGEAEAAIRFLLSDQGSELSCAGDMAPAPR